MLFFVFFFWKKCQKMLIVIETGVEIMSDERKGSKILFDKTNTPNFFGSSGNKIKANKTSAPVSEPFLIFGFWEILEYFTDRV